MNTHSKLKSWIASIKKVVQNRWFRLAVQLLILILCLLYLIDNLQTIKAAQLKFAINLPLVILSTGLTILAVFLGAFGYYLVLNALFIPINCFEAMYIHLQSNLAKYIPGYAWQLVGKAYLTTRSGVSAGLVGLAMAIELFQLIYAGIVVALLTLPPEVAARWQIGETILYLLPFIRLIAIVLFFLIPFILSWLMKKNKDINRTKNLQPITLLCASVCMFIGWILFGYSYWLLGKALLPINIDQLLVFIFTLTASFLIGLAIIIVPASIGVRESIMVWLLGPIVGAPQAVIIAALARVTVTVSELVSFFAFKVARRGLNNPKVLDPKVNSDGPE
jgi:uncharacterized membrane protein YbhN (UPF0104 family)